MWTHVAEPYRETTFRAKVPTEWLSTDLEIVWEIDGQVLPDKGATIVHTFTSTGPTSVAVTIANPELGVKETYRSDVVVKYVRREIRSLTPDDRERTLNAMEAIYRLSQTDGEALYGPNFRSIGSFQVQHLDGAGRMECDHWHDDAGLAAHHFGFTIQFEEVMQLIDPLVSLPYWEYTLDAENLDELEHSPIFRDDWFGKMSPTNDRHIVDTGRWKFLEIGYSADFDFDVQNAYGLLRAPWNTDSTPYLTRYKYVNQGSVFSTPGCSIFQQVMQKATMREINALLNGATHGPVHIEIGGQWGLSDYYIDLLSSMGYAGIADEAKPILWRMGYARCATSCSTAEAKTGECSCSAPRELYEDLGMTPYDVLEAADVFKYLMKTTFKFNDMNTYLLYVREDGTYGVHGYEEGSPEEMEVFRDILDALANPGHVGEMYTSSAPGDPTFWLIHPTAERLLNWRRLSSGVFPLDLSWGYVHSRSTNPSDNGWVCDWTGVSVDQTAEGKWEMPSCTAYGEAKCAGHGETDKLPMTFLHTDRVFRNQEFIEYLDPTNIELPYMYDNYRYEHCEETGISFKVRGMDSVTELMDAGLLEPAEL
ncbi:unnamed protein product [Heterosigma akashiwo]